MRNKDEKKLDLDGHKNDFWVFIRRTQEHRLRLCKNHGGAPEDALINSRTQSIYLQERPAARIPG